jgi:hypothetical protein
MKKYCLILASFCYSVFAFAQFEGTITWNCKMEISDPKMKAQMDKAQKEMNSPENQAKMKELEAQMNDPQFKAMMESNPDMKAMIEKQIAMMKSGNTGASMMDNVAPKSMEMKLKGTNSLTKILGGMMESEVLFQGATNKSYTLNRANKTYTTNAAESSTEADKYKITKTEEFTTVLTYKCRKYIVESTEKAQKANIMIWTTIEIKDMTAKQFSKMHLGGKNSSFMDKIEGIPLKMQVLMPNQGNMNMEVNAIKKESLSSSIFEIPTGFVEKKK